MNYRIGCACGPTIGCDPSLVGCVVGAEALGDAPGVWIKTRFWREGPYLKATVYAVAAGEPKIIELSVDLRPIVRAVLRAHAEVHAKEQLRSPHVGWSLGKLWKGAKKAAKAIGRSKLVKGVVAVTKTVAKGAKAVVKSKAFGAILTAASAFPLTAPFAAPALGAYAAANTAIGAIDKGRKVVKVARQAVSTISRGKAVAKRLTVQKTQTAAAVKTAGALMSPATKAAVAARVRSSANISLSTAGKAKIAAAVSRLPVAARAAAASKVASSLQTLQKVKAAAALAKSLPATAAHAVVSTTALEVQAKPLVTAAAATAAQLANPQLQASMVAARAQGAAAQTKLETIQKAAQSGSLDAQKSAAIVNLVARNRARIQAMAQTNAGGLPGILITPDGRLVRGKFRVQAKAGAKGLLYQGPTSARQNGEFARVSGDASNDEFESLAVMGDDLESIAINGDLPLDGIRLSGPGPNASPIGVYERIGCNESTRCAPCAARA